MNVAYLQTLRDKLSSRLDKFSREPDPFIHHSLIRFWSFLRDNELLSGVLDQLAASFPAMSNRASQIVHIHQMFFAKTELENAALAYHVIQQCVQDMSPGVEQRVADVFAQGGIARFISMFVEPLCRFLDEQLGESRAILALMRRYKQKCEWFEKVDLYNLWRDHTRRGEQKLKAHLFEYLHDQGIGFFIEPKSASGEVDLISDQIGEDRLIAEAKVFNPPSEGKTHIVDGFNQTYSYTRDYNRPFGYLVLYNVSLTDLRFTVPHQEQSTPFVIHNGKTIFLLTIDICPDKPSASKRGTLKSAEIAEGDLVQILQSAPEGTEARQDS